MMTQINFFQTKEMEQQRLKQVEEGDYGTHS